VPALCIIPPWYGAEDEEILIGKPPSGLSGIMEFRLINFRFDYCRKCVGRKEAKFLHIIENKGFVGIQRMRIFFASVKKTQ
jgi:hypothetical protein